MSFLQGLFRTRDIWQPSYQSGEPDRVLGYEVHTSAYAPKDAISFGDYKYYNIGDRGARSFKQLNELFAGNDMIGYVAKERVYGYRPGGRSAGG